MYRKDVKIKMQLPSKVYDVIKWVCMIVLPACGSLYFGLSQIWGWPGAENVSGTINIVVTFIGAIIGISTYNYNKSNKYWV